MTTRKDGSAKASAYYPDGPCDLCGRIAHRQRFTVTLLLDPPFELRVNRYGPTEITNVSRTVKLCGCCAVPYRLTLLRPKQERGVRT